MFAEFGYDGTSTNAIAQRASTSKANLFHHFRSKEALYLEVMRKACSPFQHAAVTVGSDEYDVSYRLHSMLLRDLELCRDHPDCAKLVAREILEGGTIEAQRLAHEVFREHFSQLVTLFQNTPELDGFARDIPAEFRAIMAIACTLIAVQAPELLRQLTGVDSIDDTSQYTSLVAQVLLGHSNNNGHDSQKEGRTE